MIQSLFLILTSGTNTLLIITLQIKLFEHVSEILTECSLCVGHCFRPKSYNSEPNAQLIRLGFISNVLQMLLKCHLLIQAFFDYSV